MESRNNSKAKSNFLAPIAQRSRAIKEKQATLSHPVYNFLLLPALNLIGRDNIFSARFCPFQTARVNLPRKFHRRPVSVSTPFPKISNRAEVTRNRKRVILGRVSFPRIAIRVLCIPRATCPPSLLFKSIHWTLGKALVHGGCKFVGATTAPTCRGFAIHWSLLGIKQDKGGNASAQMNNNLRCSVNIPCLELEGVFGVGYRAACTFVEQLLRREIFRRRRWWYYYRSIVWPVLNLIRLLSYLLKDIVSVDKLTEEKYMINRLIVKFDKL